MPPRSLANSVVIIFDCKCSDKEQALRALRHITLTKLLIQDKSEVKLILANAASANNSENFANIKCIADVFDFDSKKIVAIVEEELEEVENAGNSECNWLECLYFATTLVKEEINVDKKVLNHQVLFLTDLVNFQSTENEKSSMLVDEIATFFKINPVFLYIIGINIPSFNITSYVDFQEIIRKQPLENQALAKIIKMAKYGVAANFQQGVHFFQSYAFLAEPQAWNVALTFGTSLEIPCSTKRLINTADEVKIIINKEYDPDFNTGGREAVFIRDEDGRQMAEEDLVSGFKVHGKFITIPHKQAFKGGDMEKRSFDVLGFAPVNTIPEYLICAGDGTYIVEKQMNKAAVDEDDNDSCLFNTLVDVLMKEKKYLIARRVYNNNNNPKFVVLAPIREKHTNRAYFLLNQLPYADEVLFSSKEQEPTKCLSIDKNVQSSVVNFLESINLSNKDNKQGFIPSLMRYSEKITTTVEIAADNYFNTDCKLEVLNKYCEIQENNPSLQKLIELWPKREELKEKKEEDDDDDFIF